MVRRTGRPPRVWAPKIRHSLPPWCLSQRRPPSPRGGLSSFTERPISPPRWALRCRVRWHLRTAPRHFAHGSGTSRLCRRIRSSWTWRWPATAPRWSSRDTDHHGRRTDVQRWGVTPDVSQGAWLPLIHDRTIRLMVAKTSCATRSAGALPRVSTRPRAAHSSSACRRS